MPSAERVARYIIWLSAGEAERVPLTQLQLHKLLYYAQGWKLARDGEPLFPERIQAWMHGPVVSPLYRMFSQYAHDVIDAGEGSDELSCDIESCRIVESVWEGYKKYSASGLRNMTHQEQPWLAAREGLEPDDAGRREITHESMIEFFSRLAEGVTPEGIDLRDLARSQTEFDQGKGQRLEDVERALGG